MKLFLITLLVLVTTMANTAVEDGSHGATTEAVETGGYGVTTEAVETGGYGVTTVSVTVIGNGYIQICTQASNKTISCVIVQK